MAGIFDFENRTVGGVGPTTSLPIPSYATNLAPTAPLISPELQKIVDEVYNTRVSPGRKIQALTSLGSTIGGLQQERSREVGSMARLGITEPGAIERQRVTEAGATERTNLGITATAEENRLKRKPLSSTTMGILQGFMTGGVGGTTEKPAAPTTDWWTRFGY